MKDYNLVFYGIIFFLIGVLFHSLEWQISWIIFCVLLVAIFLAIFGFLKNQYSFFWLSFLFLFIIGGFLYSYCFDYWQLSQEKLFFDNYLNFSGRVIKKFNDNKIQKLVLQLDEPLAGRVLVQTKIYPSFYYGDLISVAGIIKKPTFNGHTQYLAKDGIAGVVYFPQIVLLERGNRFDLIKQLIGLKEKIIANFQSIFPLEQAAFLSGITLGDRQEFSDDFEESLRKSGTLHLVALSGYNISILILVIFYCFNYFLSRRLTFYITIILIACFVIMTGAEASVVRAAIMGILVMTANQLNRFYSFRNIIALTAFLMVLFNPKILVFDIGFQLSFLALLGIIYLAPALKNFLLFRVEGGLLNWRENLIITTAAQLAVLPVLVINFGYFSLFSLLANILILEFIPLTMFLGFAVGLIAFWSKILARLLGWFTNLFLSYEIFLINFFGSFDVALLKINWLLVILYYLAILVFILHYNNQVFIRKNDK
jgi:competence protein ComEC